MIEVVSFYFHKYFFKERGHSKEYGSFTICVIGFFFGLLFISDAGYYYFLLFDSSILYISVFINTLIELYIATFYINKDRFSKYSLKYPKEQFYDYFFYIYKYVGPALYIFFIMTSLYSIFFGEGVFAIDKMKNKGFFAYFLKYILLFGPQLITLYFYVKNYYEEKEHEKEEFHSTSFHAHELEEKIRDSF